MEEMSYLNPNMIIWINEMGSDHRQSSQQLGHHLRGLTPTDAVISIHGQRISTIAAMSPRGIEDIEVYSETTNGETFAGFVQRCIVPIMLPFSGSNPRSVLVLDNASIRHVQEVHQMIKGCGAIIRYLPPYSPDFHPLDRRGICSSKTFPEEKSCVIPLYIISQSPPDICILFHTTCSLPKFYRACWIHVHPTTLLITFD